MRVYKKTGDPKAARNQTDEIDPTAFRWRAMAAIGRVALWGLLPLRLAERLIRRLRRSA